MTSKKRRQRGSRTHGGGTHKNRRGAGHRGGRGRAGRSKHEFHNYEPKGKHGFKRPQDIREVVVEVDVQTLDEDAILYAEEGLAEETDDGFVIDARDVVEDGYEADVVKVLGSGQVHSALEVTADSFTETAREKLTAVGGDAVRTARAVAAAEEDETGEDEAATDEDEAATDEDGADTDEDGADTDEDGA